MRLAARHGVPHVLEVRDLWPESVRDLTPLGGWPLIRGIAHKTAAALSSADLIIAVTDAIAAHTKANPCCTCEVVTIPTGASAMFSQQTPSDSFRAALGLRNGPVVGYLGTLGRAQDVDAIAQAARRLDAMGVGFLVVGGGRRAARLRKRLQGSGVVIERQRSRDAMPQYWALCDVAIVALRSVPSLATAIPMKMYEGMAMGIPLVVSAPDGEATKLAAQSGCGVAVDPGDGIAIANATIKLLEDAESRQACAAAGRMAASGLTRTMQARACLQALRTALDASH
jgi:glycosyltransferase involved in cell wall biosynthesis